MPLIDLASTEVSSGFALLEDGSQHDAVIFNIEKKVSAAENDYFNFEFKTSNGRRLWDRFSLTPQALFKLKGLMVEMGLSEQAQQEYEGVEDLLEVLEENLIGESVTITVGVENYENKDRNTVRRIAPAPEGVTI